MAGRSATVVGGGIMGTSTAWALARRGWSVTLVEQGPLPNPHGSSGGVHRLIRSTYGAMAGYAAMIGPAYEAWERLWADLGRTLMTHTGMLAVDTGDEATFGADSARVLGELGLPYERLDADEVRRRYPQFVVPDDATAVHTDQAHFLRAGEIVGALGEWLRRQPSVRVMDGAEVTEVDLDAATVRTAGGLDLAADRVVLAAGPWTRRFVDVPGGAVPSRQVVLDVLPPVHLREAWSTGPAFLLPPMYGIPPRAELPLKISDHAFSMTGDPDDDRTPQREQIAEIMEVGRSALVDLDRYELLEARTCFYTVRDEERFHVAPVGERGVVLAGFSGHGFKFGALMGEATAAALDDAASWSDVTPWAAGHPT